MSQQLSTNESPQALIVTRNFGPPLPASETIFVMPFSRQARVLHYDVNVVSAVNGILLQSISLHDTTGALVFTAGLAPVLNIFVFGAASSKAIAGPEQARVPFFTPNILFGTLPKDMYALPGYEFRFQNLGNVANRTAEVTIHLSTGND